MTKKKFPEINAATLAKLKALVAHHGSTQKVAVILDVSASLVRKILKVGEGCKTTHTTISKIQKAHRDMAHAQPVFVETPAPPGRPAPAREDRAEAGPDPGGSQDPGGGVVKRSYLRSVAKFRKKYPKGVQALPRKDVDDLLNELNACDEWRDMILAKAKRLNKQSVNVLDVLEWALRLEKRGRAAPLSFVLEAVCRLLPDSFRLPTWRLEEKHRAVFRRVQKLTDYTAGDWKGHQWTRFFHYFLRIPGNTLQDVTYYVLCGIAHPCATRNQP